MSKELEMQINIDEIIKNIPAYKTCVHSEVPNGRVWCSFYDQTFAGRCNKNCRGYEDKFMEKVA